MDSFFGPSGDFNNITADASITTLAHIYTADEIALMLGALGACLATFIYSFKNIKHSSCCAGLVSCDQRTELVPSKDSIILETSIV